MSISVVVVGNDEQVVRQIEGYRGELMVTRVCEDIAEAIAACAVGVANVLLVSGRDLLPPQEQIDAVTSQQTVLVLLDEKPRTDGIVQGMLEVDASMPMLELELLVVQALRELKQLDVLGEGQNAEAVEQDNSSTGKIVCFWGAAGSPGRSTVALNYAVEAALVGKSVVILDADTFAASISIQLGLLDESASIAQLCRVIDSGSREPARLEATCLSVEVGTAVLKVATGLPRASRWPEVRASALRRATSVLREHNDLVVLDVASPLELDEQLSFDTQAPQRNAVTVEMLRSSDEVFMVVAADSVGIPRALRAIDELADHIPGVNLQIVFNKLGTANTGHSPKRRLLETWDRFGPSHSIAGYLSQDVVSCNAALLAGSPLAEIAPKSTLRTEIRGLLGIKSTEKRLKRLSRRIG
ncbi:CpaE family protein [Glutamicibacter arilaitensis]|uniref:AAA family ATPase n=1 Tax=Glutamicibacter arilaitensis TaxID=256701 RepID=UPI00384CADBA